MPFGNPHLARPETNMFPTCSLGCGKAHRCSALASANSKICLLLQAGEEFLQHLRRARSKYRARRKFHIASIMPKCFSPSKSFCYARNQLREQEILPLGTPLEVGDLKRKEFFYPMLLSAALSAARTGRFPKAAAFGVLLPSLLVTRQEVTCAQQRARCASVKKGRIHEHPPFEIMFSFSFSPQKSQSFPAFCQVKSILRA